jgi:hypothetical protein
LKNRSRKKHKREGEYNLRFWCENGSGAVILKRWEEKIQKERLM